MRILLDQGVARPVAQLLNHAGHDAIHVGDVGRSRAQDFEILAFARSESRVDITHDADFHALLALTAAVAPSVIRVRIEGLAPAQMFMILNTAISQCENDLNQGAAVSIHAHGVRMRRLPLRVP